MARKRKHRKRAEQRAAELAAQAAARTAVATPPVAKIVDLPPVATAAAPLPASTKPVDPTAAPPSPVEDLDADLDDDDASYDSLVAQVAGPAARTERRAEAEPEEEILEVIDLDDDGEAPETLDILITRTVVGARAEAVEDEDEPDAPLIDLDEQEPQRKPEPAPRQGHASPYVAPMSEVERLAAAAARGGAHASEMRAVPLDFGEVSTPEARARLLAEALAHAEHKEARYRVPLTGTRAGARWKGLAASVLFVLAGSVAIAPPAWVRPEPPARLTPGARARGLRLALLLQAQQVEAFRVRAQRLPASLQELPASLSGVRYARSGNRAYQLVAYEPDGSPIVYDSANPSPAFRSLMASWTPPDGSP